MSRLHLVATPIGNLGDVSSRARECLAAVDRIYAEDTRHSGRLLKELGIGTNLRSCHDHNEAQRAEEIVAHLTAGEEVALISDAGTPGLADPGFRVVRAAIAAGHEISMVPGPSSILMAVVLSGFPTDRFIYDGWLPRRSGRLARQLGEYATESRTVVLLESPKRLLKVLKSMVELLPTRRVAVARELTKRFEEIRRGTPAELLEYYEARAPKGELVLVMAGAGFSEKDAEADE
jgi:16S rRNA (cytidine1402-2'-O)-methyltransferase